MNPLIFEIWQVIGTRLIKRHYDLSKVRGVTPFEGLGSYDVTLHLTNDREQYVTLETATKLFDKWKSQHVPRCDTCYFWRQTDTPGNCAFCQLAKVLEQKGVRARPKARRARYNCLHGAALGLLVTLVILYALWFQKGRVGDVSLSPPPPQKYPVKDTLRRARARARGRVGEE